MKKVIIEVSGGVVQAAYADSDVQVVVVDWDDQEAGDPSFADQITTFPLSAAPVEADRPLYTPSL